MTTTNEALLYANLKVRVCGLVYGEAPCQAALGVTGEHKCFNTLATCQDRVNFDLGDQPGEIQESRADMLFAKPTSYRPQNIEAIPSMVDVQVTPARIKPGESLGTRAVVRASFREHPHSDTGPGLDPYYADRAYIPYERGTFWSKFRARQPYLRGEEFTVYNGFVGQTLAEMESALYLVENFDGPTIDGVYTLTAHDPLKMLDGDRAQCPRVSRGRLSVDLSSVATSFTVIPADIGEEYDESGWVNLGGKEMVSFTRVGDVFTIVRGQMNTQAVAHTAGDRVQQAARFDSMMVSDIIHELMTDYADMPEEWIPLGDWHAEDEGYLQRVFDATVAEPTPVAKLVDELMEQAGLSVWWDPEGRRVRLRVLRPISSDAVVFDESIMETLSIREQPERRYSEIWIYFGQISPLGGEDIDNYPAVSITTNLEAQKNYGSAKIKRIYSRWIARGGRTAADRVGRIVLARYVTPPRLFTFSVVRNSGGEGGNPVLGEGYVVSHRSLQDATGAVLPEPVQVVALRRGALLEATAEGFTYDLGPDIGDRQVTATTDLYGSSFREMHDDLYPDTNPGDTVTLVVEAQARLGGTASLPALRIGDWPTEVATGNRTSGSPVITGLSVDATAELAAGILVSGTGIPAGTRVLSVDSATQITLTANASSGAGTSTSLTFYLVNLVVENLGVISGRGGDGGKGANENGDAGSGGKNGAAGGTAIYARYPFVYRDATGLTQGGGGGGAGGSCANFDDHRGGGGGGGAGLPPGNGGDGPGSGENGSPGTLSAGGAYGRSFTSSTFWSAPELKSGVHGGAGGAPGVAGDNDVGGYDVPGGSPGAAGVCIDGISYVTQDGATGTRLGSQIN